MVDDLVYISDIHPYSYKHKSLLNFPFCLNVCRVVTVYLENPYRFSMSVYFYLKVLPLEEFYLDYQNRLMNNLEMQQYCLCLPNNYKLHVTNYLYIKYNPLKYLLY